MGLAEFVGKYNPALYADDLIGLSIQAKRQGFDPVEDAKNSLLNKTKKKKDIEKVAGLFDALRNVTGPQQLASLKSGVLATGVLGAGALATRTMASAYESDQPIHNVIQDEVTRLTSAQGRADLVSTMANIGGMSVGISQARKLIANGVPPSTLGRLGAIAALGLGGASALNVYNSEAPLLQDKFTAPSSKAQRVAGLAGLGTNLISSQVSLWNALEAYENAKEGGLV